MSSWRERARSRREVESLRMLREILNAPSLKLKREVVAQYNPMHYVFGYELARTSQVGESVEVWDALHKEQIRRRGF